MNIKENTIYCKLDNNYIIKGYYYVKKLKPKYKASACNFDCDKDLSTAIQVNGELFNKLFVNHSQIINGMFYSNEPVTI